MSDATPDPSPPPGELFNTPVEFEYKGVRYKSRRLELAEIDEFCLWLERQATEKAWYGSANLPPEARQEVLRVSGVNLGSQCFRVGGEGYLKALSQPAAGAYLLYLGLRKEHPELTADDCTAMYFAEYDRRARDALEVLGRPNSSGGRGASSGPSKASSRGSRKKGSRRG